MNPNAYHQHLDICAQCRNNPFKQCAIGIALLTKGYPDTLKFVVKVSPETLTRYKKGLDIKYKDLDTEFWYLMEIEDIELLSGDGTLRITAKFKERLSHEGDRIS